MIKKIIKTKPSLTAVRICFSLIILVAFLGVSLPAQAPDKALWSFAVIGDTRNGAKTFSKLLQLMLDDPYKPQMLFHTGDMVNRGTIADWEQYKKCISVLEGRIRVLPVIGNHDTFGKGAMQKYRENAKPPQGAHFYGFRHKDAGFIVLNGYQQKHLLKIGPEQMEWLKNTLKEMKPKVRMIFVFLHHPLITKPNYVHKEPLRNAGEVWAVLRENNVTAVFAGHEHTYDHVEKNGIHHFIVAGGGAPLYRRAGYPFFHYARVAVYPDNIKVSAIDLEGVERKEITIPVKASSASD